MQWGNEHNECGSGRNQSAADHRSGGTGDAFNNSRAKQVLSAFATDTGKHLRGFIVRYKLNTEEAAALLDVSTKTVKNYEKAAVLPRAIGIALRRFEQDPTTFAALYRPVKIRPPWTAQVCLISDEKFGTCAPPRRHRM